MSNDKALTVFENFKIRRIYDEKTETWYFSVVDIIAALIQQPDYQTARKYWNKLKERLKKEGSQSVTNCHQLKMAADDGKMRLTDVADPETLLRIDSVGSQPQGGTDQTLAGQGRLRAHSGHERSGPIARPRPGILATARPKRKMDSAADDGAGNPQQTHRLLEGSRDQRRRGICHSDQYHSSGMDRGFGQKAQGDQGAQRPRTCATT